ncbi:hypothetical protein BJ508DRAFT_311129 [Ascobolus immersus RN42]|uniref:Integrase zinc-binding domain-containing protein n=1 Tax=Ascobolus immersus RN42 TaxID=1160509 RepID=A0A3N4HWQ1_ASCIM|nr:hypothetical protein BJ508DRAFT_311129 [Ascobolus immersus RN42]
MSAQPNEINSDSEPSSASRFFSTATQQAYLEYLETRPKSTHYDAAKREKYRAILSNRDWKLEPSDPEYYTFMNKRNEVLHNFKLGESALGERENQLYRYQKAPKSSLYVVCIYEAFDIVSRLHVRLGHAGKNKTHQAFEKEFYGLSREDIAWLIGRCEHCLSRQAGNSKPELTPIRSHYILERVQIDLIDKRSAPDGPYNWILSIRDHFNWSNGLPTVAWQINVTAGHEGLGTGVSPFLVFFGREPRFDLSDKPAGFGNFRVSEQDVEEIEEAGQVEYQEPTSFHPPQLPLLPSGKRAQRFPQKISHGSQLQLESLSHSVAGSSIPDALIDPELRNEPRIQMNSESSHDITPQMQSQGERETSEEAINTNDLNSASIQQFNESSTQNCGNNEPLSTCQSHTRSTGPTPLPEPSLNDPMHSTPMGSNFSNSALRSGRNPTEMELRVRKVADRVAEKMIQKHSRHRNVTTFKPGEIVLVSIPKQDRGDSPRLPCQVLKGPLGRDGYLVRSEHGTINRIQQTKDLIRAASTTSFYTRFPPLPPEDSIDVTSMLRLGISLRTAARTGSSKTAEALGCDCGSKSERGACVNQRWCTCRRKGAKCTNYCHGKSERNRDNCRNMATRSRQNDRVIAHDVDDSLRQLVPETITHHHNLRSTTQAQEEEQLAQQFEREVAASDALSGEHGRGGLRQSSMFSAQLSYRDQTGLPPLMELVAATDELPGP